MAGILFAAFLAGSASAVDVAPPEPSDWAENQTVQIIDLRGLTRVDEGTVLRLIRTRKGRPFNRKVWDEDFHRLYDSGYFLNVRSTEPQRYPGGVMLAIDLTEKGVISKITFRGNKAVGSTKLLEIMQSHEGGRFDPGEVHKDKVKIETFYKDKAFRSIKVDYRVETVSSHRQNIGGQEIDVQDEVLIAFVLDEGSPVGVRVIRFVGNQAFSDAQLIATMETKYRRLFRAGDLKDETLEDDKNRLLFFYRKNGYQDVEITQIESNISEETYWNWFRKRKRLAELIVHISEGKQYFTGNVTIIGNESIPKEEIQSVMKVKPGSVYSDIMLFQEDHDRIIDLYGERGRVFSKVNMDRKFVTDPERSKKNPNIFDVTVEIHESTEITVREVITRGNTKTKDKVIIRTLELFPGDRVDTAKVKLAVQRLKNLNYFNDDIRITPEPAADNPEEANLIIDVAEKNTGEFNFGAGVSSVDGFVGSASVQQKDFDFRNLPKSWRDLFGGNAFTGAGETAGISASGGAKRQNYNISFFEPWAFDRPVRLGGSIFRSVDTFNNFNETSNGFNVTVGKRLWGPRWDGSITYTLKLTDVTGSNRRYPPVLKSQDGNNVLSSVSPKLVYDSRDNVILPSRGWFMQSSLELGGGPLLGTYDWIRPEINLSRFFTVFKTSGGGKHILELHGSAAAIEEYGKTNEVPPFLRYYAGGVDTIRGFEYRTITPYENGYQVGAKKEVLSTAEYSLPLYEEVVRASTFIDAGSAFDPGQADRFTHQTNTGGFRESVGVGLSVRTPFSPIPIRIYFSRALVKNPQDRLKTVDFSFATRF